MKITEKDNKLLDMVADYLGEKYETAILVFSNGDEMSLCGRHYNSAQAMNLGSSIIKNELQELIGRDEEKEENTETPLFEKILKEIGKED